MQHQQVHFLDPRRAVMRDADMDVGLAQTTAFIEGLLTRIDGTDER